MKKRAVVALGGNALSPPNEQGSFEKQLERVNNTVSQLKALSKEYKFIITHGNGSAVGNLLLQQEKSKVQRLPLDVCDAMTQGQIGYLIQKSVQNIFQETAFTIVTQVKVDEDDSAFQNPSKPVGPFYSEEEAERLSEQKNWNIKKTSEGKYRRVVPSPDPKQIIEQEPITQAAEENIVIACGGGGIPVIETEKGLEGVEAVIDKDLASEKLAKAFGAELLIILTDVDKVYLDYGTDEQKPINEMTAKKAREHTQDDQFTEGSMKPKIKAAIRFVESGGEACIITSLENAEKALKGQAGTVITR